MANTKITADNLAANAVTSASIADNSIGITQLNVSDGTNGQVLTTNGSGTLSFGDIPAGYTDSDVETYLNTSAIYTDATNDRLGIGTSSPDNKLHVFAADSSGSSAGNCQLTIENSGASGLQFLAGTTSYSEIRFGDSGDNGVGWIQYDHTNNYQSFGTAGTERMRITSSGKVGIGVDPAFKLQVSGTQNDNDIVSHNSTTGISVRMQSIDAYGHIFTTGTKDLYLGTNNTTRLRIDSNGGLTLNQSSDTNAYFTLDGVTGSYYHAKSTWGVFSAGDPTAVESFRIKGADGTLLVNRTSTFGAANATAMMVTGSGNSSCAYWTAPNTANYDLHVFFNGGLGVIGSIRQNSSLNGVAYNTSSDYRLKENVTYDWDATTRLKQLKPCRFNWISDETNTLEDGFLAHEVATAVPNAVTGGKDAMIPAVLYEETDQEVIDGEAQVGDIKEEEKINPQQLDHSKLVPLLVKTIQELEARITELENA